MADAYLQSLLGDGETIRSEARQHPMALIRFAFQPILVFLGAMVLFGIGSWLTPDGQGLFNDIIRWFDTLIGLLTAGMFLLAIVWFPIQVFRWTKRRYMVTDRRVLYVDGVLRKNSADAGLSMITDVGFRQGMIGRSLGYGDLVVATASNRPLHFRQIKEALAFKQAIMGAQHATVEARADEILVSKGLAPAVAAPAAVAAPVAAAALAAPVEPPPPVVPAWDGSDVPQMREDDTPDLDPAVLGASGVVAAAAAAAPAVDPVTAVGDPVTAAAADVTETVQAAADDTIAAAADVADEASSAAGPAVEDASTAVADTASDAATEVDGALRDATDTVVETASGSASDVQAALASTADDAAEEAAVMTDVANDAAEEAATVADVATAMADDTASATSGGHAAALDVVDSSVGTLTDDAKGSGADSVTSALASLADLRDSGAITTEEFETRKQELLERL